MTSVLVRVVVVLLMSMGVRLCADSVRPQMQENDSGLPNLSDRPQTQDRSIDIFADALYWNTSEAVDWAFIMAPSSGFEQITFKTISFDWDPGFRVGLGYNMFHDEWDTQLAYTWFQTSTSDHASGRITSAFFAARLSGLEPFQTGRVNFSIHYNMFDWDLGRRFLVSRFLSLRPFIGLKGGWINQAIHAEWTIPNFAGLGFLYSGSERVKNNFSGGGPQGGVKSRWILGNLHRHAFSLVGDFAAAYMWGHWKLEDHFTDTFLTRTSTKMGDRNFGALMFQVLLGLGWDFNFDKNRSHFALKLGYEIQDWLNQFQVFTNASGSQNSDLLLQGLTIDLRFDF